VQRKRYVIPHTIDNEKNKKMFKVMQGATVFMKYAESDR